MKVLLIGGTGLLSSEILSLCIQNGYDVSVLNRGSNNKQIEKQVKILIADFYNNDSVESVVHNLTFDVVVDFLSRKKEDIERIFPIFLDRCKQYVFISTACVYRRLKEDGIITEDSPKPNVDWSYNIEKYECEQTLIELAKNSDVKYTIVRPYITYDNTRIPLGIAPLYGFHWTIIGRILADKPIFVWDKGESITTLTRVEDFAKGVVGLLGNEKAYNEDFHITTKEANTWNEFLLLLYKILNKQPNIVEIPTKYIIAQLPEYKGILLGDRAIDSQFDNSKILDTVSGLEFSITLEDGLRRTINYYKENNFLKGIDYKYDAKIDRLIAKYVPQKIQFVDYLKANNKKEKITYLIYRYIPANTINKVAWLLKKTKIKI
ncbi:hypothetical protein FACS1894123_02200 [Bacteroidia bacterium]|nr:hypothetical protein FACS1894123_02200 [Bacteroidia bacterium]